MVKNGEAASGKYSPTFINKQAKRTILVENVEISIQRFFYEIFSRGAMNDKGALDKECLNLHIGGFGDPPPENFPPSRA